MAGLGRQQTLAVRLPRIIPQHQQVDLALPVAVDNDNRRKLHCIFGRRQNQFASPRHRSPSREMVRLQALSLCDLIDHRAWPKALRNDLRLDVVRPLPMYLTSRLPGREKLQCTLRGETPVARPWKADHRSERRGQRGSATAVTVIPTGADHDRCAQSRSPMDMIFHG